MKARFLALKQNSKFQSKIPHEGKKQAIKNENIRGLLREGLGGDRPHQGGDRLAERPCGLLLKLEHFWRGAIKSYSRVIGKLELGPVN